MPLVKRLATTWPADPVLRPGITLPTKLTTTHRTKATNRIMQTKQVLTILSALAQESRLAVYRLLIETDAPYMTPVPHRGKRNEPAMVAHTAAKLAELHGVSVSEVARATAANARRLFRLPAA